MCQREKNVGPAFTKDSTGLPRVPRDRSLVIAIARAYISGNDLYTMKFDGMRRLLKTMSLFTDSEAKFAEAIVKSVVLGGVRGLQS